MADQAVVPGQVGGGQQGVDQRPERQVGVPAGLPGGLALARSQQANAAPVAKRVMEAVIGR